MTFSDRVTNIQNNYTTLYRNAEVFPIDAPVYMNETEFLVNSKKASIKRQR